MVPLTVTVNKDFKGCRLEQKIFAKVKLDAHSVM